MPVINKTVDKTLVNGSEIFIYTFNVSYSGLSQPAQDGKLVDFFPSEIIYQLPPIGGQLVAINQVATVGGTNVEFDFGPVNAGTSITFTMSCEFGPGRSDGDTFTNTAKLYADDLLVQTGSAPMVTLKLVGKFTLLKYPQISAPVTPGQVVTFVLDLQNAGDAGAELTNVLISDILPSTLIPVTSFLPVGNDTGTSLYSDTTYNGLTGTWSGNTLNFNLPSYKGVEYKILFKATIAPNVVPGSTITNIANWTANGTQMTPASTTFTVYETIASANLLKSAPDYGKIGEPIFYYLIGTNNGTVNLDNYVMTDILPNEVDITQIAFNFGGGLPETYSIYIETSNAVGTYIPVVTNLSINSGAIDLVPFIPISSRVLSVRVIISSVTTINSGNSLYLYGNVNNSATLNQVITNNSTLTATSTIGDINKNASDNTTLNGKSALQISKTISPQLAAYYPLNEFRMTLSTSSNTSMIINPVISDLLPLGLAYIPNSYYYIFTDILTGKTYDSRNSGFPIQAPIPEVIKNYNGTGRTLIRMSFTNYILQMISTIQVFFDVIVELNPPSSFTNIGYEGNPGNNSFIDGSTIYTDILDLDGDTITNEQIAQSNTITGAILTTSEFSLEKWVKGNQDTDFSKAAFTTPGGNIIYNLNITNNQSSDLKNIDIVDILPYIGDTGVILNTTPRGSEFNVYATTIVTAKIVNVLGNPVDPNPNINIEYSTSKDPIRFDETGTGTIGTGTWSTTPPIDVTTIQAIRVTTDSSVILKSYERLVITINAVAPVGTLTSKIAYNSFAVMADKVTGGVVSTMNPAEPNKVSVQIATPTNGSIGNFVWNDLNGNGLYDSGEPGVNGITVELYDGNNNLLQTTTTANNVLNSPGYYNFANLAAGNYYVKFIPYTPYTLTIKQANMANGSKPNQTTGLTDLITLTQNQNLTTINAGLLGNISNGSIGNFVWNDLNGNGLYDLGEPGVNGITVELYDGNNNLLKTTITANNVLNNPGYYNFANLAAGNYYVKFIPYIPYTLTIKQANMANGSKPNQTTGLTDLITLTQNQNLTTINAGVIEKTCNPPVINASDKKILLGTTFNPLTGVTATDCAGDDITASIIVTSNDVDTNKVGVYHVTYSVTDKNGQTTIKTITVIVYTIGPRDQAVNDIIESVALVQTALSHILNAEGEKLQKAIKMKLTKVEILKINKSITDMSNAISYLEIVLESKLEIFKCKYCKI